MTGSDLVLWTGLLACAAASFASDASGDLAAWDKSLNLRGGLGYKDNVLLRKSQRQGSAFWQSSADLMLLRASAEAGSSAFSWFLMGEDRRYFDSAEVRKEQLVLTQAKWEKPFLGEWKAGALVQYMYADQVLDASASEEILETLPVKSHNMQAAPFISRALPSASRLELKLNVERQLFNEPLDDYWEISPQLTFSKRFGRRTDLAVSYTYDDRAYDTRRQSGLDAVSIPGTSLRYGQHEFEATLTRAWDQERHWRSRVRLVFEMSRDNGPGYYDYDRHRWSKRFGYYGKDWEATIEGKILYFDYAQQRVSGGSAIRQVWEYALTARAEKKVWKSLKLFAESEHETVSSNQTLEEYAVNTVLGGVDWEF